ncbi:LysR family transcriptional regulator [Gluconobacter aidae]|uniref:LysR family transcriptional regulator n=1 Tax=Gluconobacter aidae TaxID=2662454 RepID=A0A7X1VN18_9PROT|nr:LysR family transcriptional regulator [Gluconobacter aidae]MQR99283.1 LysR family transcriptional regulator [Gluconobacter aidae]
MFPGALKVFFEVVQAGSIRKASDAMGVSPSSVSRQVAVFERQMGTKLIKRGPGGISLTHAGQLAAAYARSVVLEFDALKADLDDMRGSRRRLIRIATVESVVASGPCQAIADFRRQFDDVTFRLTMMPAPQVVEAVKKDLCEIGLAMNPRPDPTVRTLGIIPEPIVLAVPEGHRFRDRSSISLAEAISGEVVTPDDSFGIWRILDRALREAGLSIRPAMIANSFEALRDYARMSGCGAILPSRAASRAGEPTTLVPIPIESEPLMSGAVHVIANGERRMPRILTLFADVLVKSMPLST